jgi:Flp pilus assembly protein TadD
VRHPLTKDSVRLLAWRELARRTGDSSLLELAYAIEHRDETDRVRRAKLLAFAGAQALEDQRREDALRLYGLALQNDAANVDALYGLALLRLQAGRLSQARNLLTAATKLEPEEPAIASLLERVRRIADSEGVNPPP